MLCNSSSLYFNGSSHLRNSEHFAKIAMLLQSSESTIAGGCSLKAHSFSSPPPHATPRSITQCRIWPRVFPLAGFPSQIYLGRHSTKENTFFTSSSIKSMVFILLGSYLSTE